MIKYVLACMMIISFTQAATAESTSGTLPLSSPFQSVEEDTIRVGLVLSGGGALGIAHIGIIQAIEEAGLRIDYITGTSMGSLVGSLYSIGYTSDQLMEIVLSNNFNELFLDRRNRRYISNYEKLIDERTSISFPVSRKGIDLPAGIITGQSIYTFLSRLTWPAHGLDNFRNLPIPFAAIGTDIETGTAKVFDSGYLPDALRASISLPSIFTPHEIDGKLYVDGGLIRNLPVQDAIEMGANYTIAVNVGSPLMPRDSLTTLSSILTQTMLFRVIDNVEIQKNMADYFIDVEELNAYSPADFDNGEKFIEIGQREGRKHLDKFREIASMQTIPPPPRPGIGAAGSLPFSQIEINGNTIYDNEFILNLLEFEADTYLSPELIEDKISRLYSSQYIDLATYRILPSDDYYYTLQINIVENMQGQFSTGLRYESDTKASILLEGLFHNLIHKGSITRAEARLGDRMNFRLDHSYFGPLESRFAFLTSFEYNSENVDWFTDGNRVARFNNEVFRAEMSLGNYHSTNNMITLGVRKDFIAHNDIINQEGILSSDHNYHALFLRFLRDNLNRKSYPTKGYKMVFENYISDQFILSPIDFTSTTAYFTGWQEITSFISVNSTLWASYTTGRELPWDYWNSPNRYTPLYDMIHFGGVDRYEIASRNVQMASFGIQFEPFHHRFIGLDIYGGKFMDNWNFDISKDDIDLGISLTLGAQTIMGPIKVLFSHSTFSRFKSEVQIGYQF